MVSKVRKSSVEILSERNGEHAGEILRKHGCMKSEMIDYRSCTYNRELRCAKVVHTEQTLPRRSAVCKMSIAFYEQQKPSRSPIIRFRAMSSLVNQDKQKKAIRFCNADPVFFWRKKRAPLRIPASAT